MKNLEIQQLEKEFHNYENSFNYLLKEYTERIERTEYSKGWYYNIFPFENEIDGFHKGKILKTKPSKINKIIEYGFDSYGRIILIIEHLNSVLCNYSFINYINSEIKVYKYVGGNPHLQNITTIYLLKNELINTLYNLGKYGCRIDTYYYNSSNEIYKVHRIAKEYTSEQIVECDILFKYDNGILNEIKQCYANGYSRDLYSI